jgi:hypothetical protein
VFSILNPKELERVFRLWIQEICGKYKGIVSIDGKEICGARTPKGDGSGSFEPLRMVTPGLHPTEFLWGRKSWGRKATR